MEIKIDTERLSVGDLRALIRMFNELLKYRTHKEEPVDENKHIEYSDNVVGGFASMFSNESNNRDEESNSNEEEKGDAYNNEIQLY